MSQSDSFIDEVTEEVRRDRLYATLKRYGWIGIVLVLVIVGGAAWYEVNRARTDAASRAFGDALLAGLEAESPQERVTALDTVSAPGPTGDAIRLLMQASEAVQADDRANAVGLLTQVASNSEVPPIYRAIAEFRALILQSETLSPEERRAGFEALAVPGAPLRPLAQEQMALTYVEAGETEAALEILEELQTEAGVSAGLRQRTSQLIVTLGGGQSAASGETAEDTGETGADAAAQPAE